MKHSNTGIPACTQWSAGCITYDTSPSPSLTVPHYIARYQYHSMLQETKIRSRVTFRRPECRFREEIFDTKKAIIIYDSSGNSVHNTYISSLTSIGFNTIQEAYFSFLGRNTITSGAGYANTENRKPLPMIMMSSFRYFYHDYDVVSW